MPREIRTDLVCKSWSQPPQAVEEGGSGYLGTAQARHLSIPYPHVYVHHTTKIDLRYITSADMHGARILANQDYIGVVSSLRCPSQVAYDLQVSNVSAKVTSATTQQIPKYALLLEGSGQVFVSKCRLQGSKILSLNFYYNLEHPRISCYLNCMDLSRNGIWKCTSSIWELLAPLARMKSLVAHRPGLLQADKGSLCLAHCRRV